MSKYYLAHNAGNREIAGERFEVVEIKGGTALGVFEATTDKQIAALDKAVANPQNAIEEISPSEYSDFVKKKLPSFNNFKHSNTPGLQMSMRGVAAVVVEEPRPEDDSEAHKLDSVTDALNNVGKVEPTPSSGEPAKPKKK